MNRSSTQHSGWTMALGILLIVLGLITMGAQVFTTFTSLLFLGWMLIIGGVGEFFYGFFSGSFGRAILYFISGVITFLIGASVVAFPGFAAATITLLIGLYMLIIGVYRALSSLIARYPSWGWNFVSGVVTLILGGMILSSWPLSGLWIIGLFIGVELFIIGFAMTLNAISPESEYEAVRYGRTPYMSGAKGGKSEKDKDKKHE